MWSAVRIFSVIGIFEFCSSMRSVSGGWRIRRENELVGQIDSGKTEKGFGKAKNQSIRSAGFN